jgi:large subunit ribosomal protein L27
MAHAATHTEEYVIPGNIIFRQRGTKWYPGENCGMGRDHTIFSLAHGYVKYYKDPLNHPRRQFIGVVFDRADRLPYPPDAARRRRLGMLAVKMEPVAGADGGAVELEAAATAAASGESEVVRKLAPVEKTRRRSYIIRESNWEIGRAAEKAGVKATAFTPGDRFRAWRKRTAKKARAAEKRTLGGKAKKPAQRRK